jgi:hypothetical protein
MEQTIIETKFNDELETMSRGRHLQTGLGFNRR